MSEFLSIHSRNPQPRLIKQAVEVLRSGGVIAYPTDSCYALGCHIGDKTAMQKIARIRQIDKHHHFTLVCRDLSELGNYAKVDNTSFRLLKAATPGPYTFILQATREVPKRLQNPKRKTIGLRVPDNAIVNALLEMLDEPIMSSTLIVPGAEVPLSAPEDIRDSLGKQLDLIIDGGNCGLEPTSVIDLVTGQPMIVRRGRGDLSLFE